MTFHFAPATTLLLFVTTATWPARADDSVDLRPKWIPGETIYVEFTWSDDLVEEGTSLPQTRKVKQDVTYGFLYEVVEVLPSGTVHVELTIDRAAIGVRGERLDIWYDTDRPLDARGIAKFGARIQSIVGHRIALWLGPNGDVQALHGCRAAQNKLIFDWNAEYGRDVGYLPVPLSNHVLTNIWQQYHGYFAFKEVKPGDAWQKTWTNDPFFGDLTTSYTLERIEKTEGGHLALVTHLIDQKMPRTSRNTNGTLHISGPNKVEGRTQINTTTGRIVSSTENTSQRWQFNQTDCDGTTEILSKGSTKAKHTLIVQTLAQRQAAKASAQGPTTDQDR